MNCEHCGQPMTKIILTDLGSGAALETWACWNSDCVEYGLPLPTEAQAERLSVVCGASGKELTDELC